MANKCCASSSCDCVEFVFVFVHSVVEFVFVFVHSVVEFVFVIVFVLVHKIQYVWLINVVPVVAAAVLNLYLYLY